MPRDLGWKRSLLNQSATRVYLAGQCIAPRRNGWVDNESGEMGRQQESQKETVIWKRGALEGPEVKATKDGSRGMARLLSLGSLSWLSTSCFLLLAASILNEDWRLTDVLVGCLSSLREYNASGKKAIFIGICNCKLHSLKKKNQKKHSKYWRTHCQWR